MTGIEFVDDYEPSIPTGHRVPRSELLPDDLPRRRVPWRTWAPAAAGGVAVVLVLVAPWRDVFELSGTGPGAFLTAMDGWGRYSNTGGDNVHGSRYGIVTCAAAGMLLVGVALRLAAALLRRRGLTAWGTGLVIAALGVLGGTVGAMALEIGSLSDTLAEQRRQSRFGQGPILHEGLNTGGAVWLCVAAVVVGLVTLALPMVLREREIPPPAAGTLPPPAPARPAPQYVPHPDDETLDG